jgi:two-component system, NarL family, response regulator NreC
MSIRIIIADDHRIIREGIRTLLNRETDIEVVGEAENGRRSVELVLELKPDVIVMDITMPDLNGIEATRQILSKVPNARVIALSMHSDRRFVTGVIGAGASGYLFKDCAFQELAEAIRIVADGKIYLSPKIAGIVRDDYINGLGGAPSALSVLSDREREVLQLIAEGFTVNQISAKLFISAKTIETHRKNIMDKLNIHSVAELTKLAVREGLTSLES